MTTHGLALAKVQAPPVYRAFEGVAPRQEVWIPMLPPSEGEGLSLITIGGPRVHIVFPNLGQDAPMEVESERLLSEWWNVFKLH